MAPDFGVEDVTLKVVTNSRVIFVAGLTKYWSVSVPRLRHNSIQCGVAICGRRAHFPLTMHVPFAARFLVYADV
jgi:hypothetical protein